MTVLQNFPMVSQLTPITSDGQASENMQFDCVPACLCAGTMYLKGVAQVNAEYNPDRFLDAAYGEGHKGGTDAKEYVTFLATLGIRLYSVSTASAISQVEEVHRLLAQGLPAVLTILDPYVPASYGWTHAVITFAEKPGEITVLDPYIGKPVTKSDSEWVALSRSDLLWILEGEDMTQPLSITMPEVARLFRQIDANHWESKATGYVLHDAHLHDYIARGQVSLDYLGDVVSPEKYLANGDSVLFFQGGARRWVKATGKVVSFDMFSAEGQAILRRALGVPAPAPEAPQEHAVIEQIKALVQAIP